MNDHEGVQECYKRYEKLTAGTSKNVENDLSIKSVYYTSQWLSTHRKQYIEKLQGVLKKTQENDNLKQVRRLIDDMTDYFEIPLK